MIIINNNENNITLAADVIYRLLSHVFVFFWAGLGDGKVFICLTRRISKFMTGSGGVAKKRTNQVEILLTDSIIISGIDFTNHRPGRVEIGVERRSDFTENILLGLDTTFSFN